MSDKFITLDDLQGDHRDIVVSEAQIGQDHTLYQRLKAEATSRGVTLRILPDDDFAAMTGASKPKLKTDDAGVYTDDSGKRFYVISQATMGEHGAQWYSEQKRKAAEMNLPIWYSN